MARLNDLNTRTRVGRRRTSISTDQQVAALGDSVLTHGRYVLPALRAGVHEICAVPTQHLVPARPQRDAPVWVRGWP